MPNTDNKLSGPARKALILDLLERADGWCSGEALSTRLGISRAAVGKHVNALRGDGHAIVSAPRRGYWLRVKSGPLDQAEARPFLTTRVLGQREWRCFGETGSTNDQAIIWAAAGAAEGSLVLAEQQTGGKGRKGRAWFSAPRGLAFSIILRPDQPETGPGLLTSLAVVAVTEAVRQVTGLEARPDSPNDLALNGRKIGGVLVETGFRGPDLDWAVVGVGCNVNALPDDFPPELRSTVGSLLIEGGVTVDRARLLAVILARLEHWYVQVEAGQPQLVEERWRQLEFR